MVLYMMLWIQNGYRQKVKAYGCAAEFEITKIHHDRGAETRNAKSLPYISNGRLLELNAHHIMMQQPPLWVSECCAGLCDMCGLFSVLDLLGRL